MPTGSPRKPTVRSQHRELPGRGDMAFLVPGEPVRIYSPGSLRHQSPGVGDSQGPGSEGKGKSWSVGGGGGEEGVQVGRRR